MRELWSREDEQDLAEFLDAVRRSDLVGAMFSIEGTPPAARRPAEAVLDAAASAVRQRTAGTRSSFQKARLLSRVLSEELGFAGDEDDYYDPRNVLLGPLLERRKGMPILLSVLWMEVGRRAGIPVAGIGLPGHFIVRVGPPPGTLADPFAGGVPLTVDDCRRKVKALAGGRGKKRHRAEPARLVPGPPAAAREVSEDALEKRRSLHLPEVVRAPGDAPARESLHLPPAVVDRERHASREGIRERPGRRPDAHDEVTGEADARDRDPRAPAHLHPEDREEDRHPLVPLEQRTEEDVAWVVVVVLVAGETQLFGEDAREEPRLLKRGPRPGRALPHDGRGLVENALGQAPRDRRRALDREQRADEIVPANGIEELREIPFVLA